MKNKQAKTKLRVGSVFVIPISHKRMAFGRVYRDGIAVYNSVSNTPLDASRVSKAPVAFFAACVAAPIEAGKWPTIGYAGFANVDHEWLPPRYVSDVMDSSHFQIYHKGKLREAKPSEIKGLDEFAVYSPKHIVDRILSEVVPSRTVKLSRAAPSPRSKRREPASRPALSEAGFWKIINAERNRLHNAKQYRAALRRKLAHLSADYVHAFQIHVDEKLISAYSWDLWGAAYLINRGCSDDGFAYFRAWLIALGKDIYRAAIRDPDTLADVADPKRDDHECEELLYAAKEAYKTLTGAEMPVTVNWPRRPRGRRWDFEDSHQMSRRLPKLSKLYRL